MKLRVRLSGGSLCWKLPLSRSTLRAVLQAMLTPDSVQNVLHRLYPLQSASTELDLEVGLVRDGAMAAFNQQHLACRGATNILSFPAVDGEHPPSVALICGDERVRSLGSLIFNVDALRRECLLYGQDPEEHCLRLFAHGMGHLLGYDHGVAMEQLCAAMELAAQRVYQATLADEACSPC